MPPPEVPDPFQLKVKAGTAVVTAVTLAGLLLFDWNKATGGQETVFSGIRPAIKQTLNWVYGIEPRASRVAPPQHPRQEGSRSSDQRE